MFHKETVLYVIRWVNRYDWVLVEKQYTVHLIFTQNVFSDVLASINFVSFFNVCSNIFHRVNWNRKVYLSPTNVWQGD